jgi:hypothetical protein
MKYEYLIYTMTTGYFTGAMDPVKLQKILNHHADHGYRFVKDFHEETKYFFFFTREAHFLLFERVVEG